MTTKFLTCLNLAKWLQTFLLVKPIWHFLSASKACNIIKKGSLAQVFSCEFCAISRNIFFYRTPTVAASEKGVLRCAFAKEFEVFWIVQSRGRLTKSGALRSSHQRCSVRKGVLRNFANFTGKHLCQSLFFNKVAGNRPVPECFPMNFSKFLKAPFFLLNFSGGWFCVSSFDLAFFIMILSFYVGDSVAAKNWAD